MLMLDLFSGLGGASQAMRDRGWKVITVDINPAFNPNIVTDIRYFTWKGNTPDLIWCSPPCDEFAREFMPWSATGIIPSIDLMLECVRIIREAKPRYWIIENVKGAIKYFSPVLGNPKFSCNPYFLWGVFPDIDNVIVTSNKEKLSSNQAEKRGLIPYRLSKAVACAIEYQLPLFEMEYQL